MTIRATCPQCGEVDLLIQAVEVELDPGFAEGQWTSGTYSFGCPGCGERVTRPASRRVARLLTASGAHVIGPDGAFHPEDPPDGPPLTWDDLLDLHLELECEDWFDELVELTV